MKNAALWLLIAQAVADCLAGIASAQPLPHTAPGLDAVKSDATGFFHTKQIGKTWWIIDPNGRGFYAVGVGHVRFEGQHCERLGYAPYEKSVQARYGSRQAWGDATLKRLSDWGFNTLGELSSLDVLAHKRPAHTAFTAFGYGFAKTDGLPTAPTGYAVFPNVFSPKWPEYCDSRARELCSKSKDDPWLLGYFIDNELAWGGPHGCKWGLFDEAWKEPAEDPAKQAWIAFLKSRLKSPSDMTANWGCPPMTWEELAANQSPLPPMTDLAYELCRDWLRLVAERYFQTVTSALRRHDPNHMILGVRFTTDVPDILDVVGKYCDTVSVNFYPHIEPGERMPRHEIDLLADWHKRSGKPLFISEWSFPAFDSGLPCTIGAGMRVETQRQRAQCSAEFQETLFRLPFVVGSNYFMWTDEPALGIASHHPENTNYGLVNEKDEPYAELLETVRSVNARVGKLHSEGRVPAGAPPRAVPRRLNEFPRSLPLPDGEIDLTGLSLRVTGPASTGAWDLSYAGTHLANVQPSLVLHHKGYRLPVPTQSRVVSVGSNDSATSVDFELSCAGPEMAYRSLWRMIIPRDTADWMAMRCLNVENTGTEPFRLYEARICLHSDIGRNDVADTPFGLSNVWRPFYRNGSFLWDEKASLGVGATFLNYHDFAYFFSKDEQKGRGELKHRIDITLAPGQRWDRAAPIAFFFPMQHDSAAHFARAVECLMSCLSH